MKTQTVIDNKTDKGYTEIEISPKDLSGLVEQFAKAYYVNRKDYGTVTVRQLVKDIIKAEPQIKLCGESNASIEELEEGITQ